MKLGELLTEQKDGEEAVFDAREKISKKETFNILEKNIDEDYGIILTSKFLNEMSKDMMETNEDISCAVKNIAESFSLLEEKRMTKGSIPMVFGRIQLDVIKENFEIIQEELQNLKTLKKYNKEEITKMLAFIKFSSTIMAEESKNESYFLDEFENSVLNENVNKEVNYLQSVYN